MKVLDAIAATYMLHELFPKAGLADAGGRQAWLKEMQRTKPLIESWLSLFNNTGQRQAISRAMMSEIRLHICLLHCPDINEMV